MSVMPTPAPTPLFDNPCPFRFTGEQYRRMMSLGFFDNCRVELLDGEVIETRSHDPVSRCPPSFRFSREQYYQLGELGVFSGHHVELIRGEIVVMSPITEPHVTGVSLATDILKAAFGPGHYVRVQAPLNLGTTDLEPDLAVVPGGPRDYAAPPATALLIVEVASTSLAYDTTTKAEEYATAGIADYWVLDLENRQLLVYRDPQPIPGGGSAYRDMKTFGPADTVAPQAAPHAAVKVADLLP